MTSTPKVALEGIFVCTPIDTLLPIYSASCQIRRFDQDSFVLIPLSVPESRLLRVVV